MENGFDLTNYDERTLAFAKDYSNQLLAIELTVTMFLTPYWLQTMYGIPFFASQFVRILKSCVMIPVGIIIVYTMNRMIQKVIR